MGNQLRRRDFIELAGAGTLAVWAAGLSPARALARPSFPADPWALGVASGDPAPDGVVLWTRLAPRPLEGGGMPQRKIPVRWEVARDDAFRRVVRRGRAWAVPELAHSVHAEVEGLQPGREYFYRFKAGPEISPVGRTRTAPPAGCRLDALRFAFASCQAWPDGFYTGYRHLAQEDLDVVLHLGDYIYEYGINATGGARNQPVPDHLRSETVTLERYRTQYGLYKSDPDLQTAHAAHPWIVTLDDHEVENNWARDVPEKNTPTPTREQFLARRAAAFQAYYEHLPLRRSSLPRGPDMRLYRRLAFGDLAEFNVLDVRQYMDDQACGDGAHVECAERLDPARTLTGAEQERWLLDGMAASRARWNVIAQQFRVVQFDHGSETDPNLEKDGYEGFGMDSWDGYVGSRNRIFGGIAERGVSNPLVLTGDWHRNLVADVKADYADPDSPTVATELVGTSMSSGGNGQDTDAIGRNGLKVNPHVRFYNIQRGYVSCRLDRSACVADFKVLPYVTQPGAPISTRATYVIEDGRPGAQAA